MRHPIPVLLSLFGLLFSLQASASISLSSTRVIFDGSRKEANVTVRNGSQKVLVQSWIDSYASETKTPPFAVSPPLARVEANEQQLLRILYEGNGLPPDKESVVWLNVQEIPQSSSADANTLQLAVRQRIKVFFRPAGLQGEAARAPEQLTWELQRIGGQLVLKVKNHSLFHVSLADLKIGDLQKSELVADATMITPGEERTLKLNLVPNTQSLSLWFSSINDYGALRKFEAKFSSSELNTVRAKEITER
ncbi:fimbrial biogenesis chaperone [Pseudomonas sp. LB3P14]